MVSKGLEMQLLESWHGWDELDIGDLMFYQVKLKPEVAAKIGGYEGTLDMALNTSKSYVEFYGFDGQPVCAFRVNLTLGDAIDQP